MQSEIPHLIRRLSYPARVIRRVIHPTAKIAGCKRTCCLLDTLLGTPSGALIAGDCTKLVQICTSFLRSNIDNFFACNLLSHLRCTVIRCSIDDAIVTMVIRIGTVYWSFIRSPIGYRRDLRGGSVMEFVIVLVEMFANIHNYSYFFLFASYLLLFTRFVFVLSINCLSSRFVRRFVCSLTRHTKSIRSFFWCSALIKAEAVRLKSNTAILTSILDGAFQVQQY